MIKEAIEKIIGLSEVKLFDVDGETYTTEPLHFIKKRKNQAPESLLFSTLSGIVDLASSIEANESLFYHVTDFNDVALRGGLQLSNGNERFEYARAFIKHDFVFGKWYDLETFIVSVQSLFVNNDTINNLLSSIGNIANEDIQTNRDDGVSQIVQVRTGITTKSNVTIQNPLTLQPYRTFREIEQPNSDFIFRMNDKGGLRCALFEADGGVWKIEAIERIKKWIRENSELIVMG